MLKNRHARPSAWAIALLLATAGCVSIPGFGGSTQPKAVRPADAPLAVRDGGAAAAFAVSAAPGQVLVVDDPAVGGRAEVSVGHAYSAASGLECRRFNTVALDGDRTPRAWAVCRDAGGWRMVNVGAALLAR